MVTLPWTYHNNMYNAADCGVPLVDRNVMLDYSSTLEGSILTLTCENDTCTSADREILRLSVTCHSSGNWIPDPTQFTCSPSTTVPPGTEILIHSSPYSSGSKYLSQHLLSSTIVKGLLYMHALFIIDTA